MPLSRSARGCDADFEHLVAHSVVAGVSERHLLIAAKEEKAGTE